MSIDIIQLTPTVVVQGSSTQKVEVIAAYEPAASLLAKLLTVDGAGSGLDADLLDGLDSSYYTNIPARLGFTPLNAATYTAADVLAKLLTVDGAGSGLDADTLDGLDSSAFARLNQNVTFANLTTTGNTILGDASGDTLTINSQAASVPNGMVFTGGNVGIGVPSTGPKFYVQSAAGNSSNATAFFTNGTAYLQLLPAATNGAYNNLVVAGDQALIYTAGAIDSGSLVIGPHSAGAKGMRIDTSGNVGIGTTPTQKLHVAGTGFTAVLITSDSTNESQLRFATNTGARISQQANQPLIFDTNATERMRIDASGNVGIGITGGLLSRVHASADNPANGYLGIFSNSHNVAGRSGAYIAVDSASVGTWKTGIPADINAWTVVDVGAAAERMRIDASGNVGIGATPSGFKLDFGSGAGGTIGGVANIAGNSDSGAYSIWAGRTTLNGGWLQFYGGSHGALPNVLVFGRGANESMRIDASGNVQIGTSTNTQNAKLTSESNGGSNGIMHRDTAASGSNAFGFQSRFTQAAGTGFVHFVGVAAGSTVFQVLGNGNVQNSNNSYGATSDLKLKQDIEDATPKLEQLRRVRMVNYALKTNPEHKLLGVIAQELESVFPGLVEETVDRDANGNDLGTTTKAVKYSVFVPILIKAVQELATRVEALEPSIH